MSRRPAISPRHFVLASELKSLPVFGKSDPALWDPTFTKRCFNDREKEDQVDP